MKKMLLALIFIFMLHSISQAEIVRVVYKENKTVAIIHPAPKSKLAYETVKQWLNRVFTRAMQGELKEYPYEDIDESLLPKAYEDRDAWEGKKGVGVYVNQEKAKKNRTSKKRYRLIKEEEKRILRQQAEQNLINKGIIPPQ